MNHHTKSCYDCKHLSGDLLGARLCSAPQLVEFLDGPAKLRNTETYAETVRDFKMACGHDGKWHVPLTP